MILQNILTTTNILHLLARDSIKKTKTYLCLNSLANEHIKILVKKNKVLRIRSMFNILWKCPRNIS